MKVACLAVGPDAVLSHWSAAAVHGLAKPGPSVEVTVVGREVTGMSWVTVHRARRLDRVDRVWVRRLPVTTVARTLIDLAAGLDAEALEALVDEAVAARLTSLGYLRVRLKALGTRGRKGARTLAAILDARGSPRRPARTTFERLLAKALDGHGIERPEREFPVQLPDGRWRYPDLSYPDCLLLIEADSYRHHSSLSDWRKDHERNNELEALGWHVLLITYDSLRADPAGVADLVRRALETCRKSPEIRG